jgi:nitrogen fixation protein NifB
MKEHVKRSKKRDRMKNHPCFSEEAHDKFGRIHLPVAPACNIRCGYCDRRFDCVNESRPGVSSVLLDPDEAVARVGELVERNERLTVVGVAGPGDPLANEETFRTFRQLNRIYPDLLLCVSTNGLNLPDRLEDLVRAGVRGLTVTINAVFPETALKICSWINYRGKVYEGLEAAEILCANQWRGLLNAIDAGMTVKVNTVLVPGINEADIPYIAWSAGRKGADVMNIMPLIPQADFAHIEKPSPGALHAVRLECGKYLKQMSHCRQCRADACGTLNEDGDMEYELLASRMGEEYCETLN